VFLCCGRGCRKQRTYCDYSVVFHETLLGAGKETQESENERCSAQYQRDQSREAHGVCWFNDILRSNAISSKGCKSQTVAFYSSPVASKGKYNNAIGAFFSRGKGTSRDTYLTSRGRVCCSGGQLAQAPSASPSAPACAVDRH
jgi:hypothetical protein